MSDANKSRKEILSWANKRLEKVVQEITDRGVIDSPLLESRLAWTMPFEIVIGKLRDQGSPTEFLWVIGGSVPTDCLHSNVAASAREAARHFSMKWQLEAARYENPEDRRRLGLDPSVDWNAQANALVSKAEFLYSVVDEDRLWTGP